MAVTFESYGNLSNLPLNVSHAGKFFSTILLLFTNAKIQWDGYGIFFLYYIKMISYIKKNIDLNMCRILLLLIFSHLSIGRIHKLDVTNDSRKYISISTFGYYTGGMLSVNLTNFHSIPLNDSAVFGFSFDKTLSDALNPYLDRHQIKCILEEPIEQTNIGSAVFFHMNLTSKIMYVTQKNSKNGNVAVFEDEEALKKATMSSNNPYYSKRKLLSKSQRSTDGLLKLPLQIENNYVSTQFIIYIPSVDAEGLYILNFHNCPNYKGNSKYKINFRAAIIERNGDNYLSGGEMPLPTLYFLMAKLFFLSGCFWAYLLAKSKYPVFKIHYLMALLVFIKSLSLLFHGINFHFIQIEGEHVAAWAILYYITHLLKGSVLFIVIVLVGTGWNFIKHILSEKDKKVFMVVIPLQVLANIAKIILEESEEGDAEHRTWWDIYILVDLLCCGAIMFPVLWSIRHLQEASQTDGKAAINLRKLRLFRHFYIMIVCYIYFIYFIVYFLKITVPFQFEWLDEFFRELATYILFVLTGYKFRPASANPYFQVPSEEENEESCVVISENGLTEGLKKVNRVDANNTPAAEEEKNALISVREGSHELD